MTITVIMNSIRWVALTSRSLKESITEPRYRSSMRMSREMAGICFDSSSLCLLRSTPATPETISMPETRPEASSSSPIRIAWSSSTLYSGLRKKPTVSSAVIAALTCSAASIDAVITSTAASWTTGRMTVEMSVDSRMSSSMRLI